MTVSTPPARQVPDLQPAAGPGEPVRIHGLDQLRGLLAFSVMLYHYALWSEVQLPALADSVLHMLGIYAVSSFYVLSGAALFIVYHKKPVDFIFLRDFAIKRTARIVPLFWLATTLNLLPGWWQAGWLPSREQLVLTYSLAFSWLDPSAYYAVGAWSIGNEWAFYSLFPLLMLAWRFHRIAFGALLVLCACCGLVYAYRFLDASVPYTEQWDRYIEPLNQVVLFAFGVALGGPILRRGIHNRTALWVGGISTAVFVALAHHVYQNHLPSVMGFNRVVFVVICFAWCYAAGLARPPALISGAVEFLGKLSYSVYLLHPLAHNYLNILLRKLHLELEPGLVAYGLALPLTLVASWASYTWMEKPAMQWGKRLVARLDRRDKGA